MDRIKKLVAKTFREELIQVLDKKGRYHLASRALLARLDTGYVDRQ